MGDVQVLKTKGLVKRVGGNTMVTTELFWIYCISHLTYVYEQKWQ